MTTLFKTNTQYFKNNIDSLYGGILWSVLKPNAPIRITPDLLVDLQALQTDLLEECTRNASISFQVFSSDIPGIFSLGGDLGFFSECVRNRDVLALKKYAEDSVDLVYKSATNYQLPITTISLVEGIAAGGGFEMALSANYLFAEEQAKFTFPETRFGLFPGMGAFTLLRQKVPTHIAEEIIYSGQEFSAQTLFEMNVVDYLCKPSEGKATILNFIKKRHKKHHAIHAMRKMVQRHVPLNKYELDDIVSYWVATVMKLDAKQLRLIDVLSQTTLKNK